jgi:hypothetical protein
LPYCRRCGTLLEENARYCQKCGTPVAVYVAPPPVYHAPQPRKPWYKDTFILITVGLVAILLVAVFAVTLLSAPFASWDSNQSLEDKTLGVKTLNLNFNTNVGAIEVFTQKMSNTNVGIYIQANGGKGLLSDSSSGPLTVEFENQTVGDVLTVNSVVRVQDAFTSNAHVKCSIYVDPALNLNLNFSSTTGQISFIGDNAAKISSLILDTTTGEVQANLNNNVTVAGNITLSATTGAVNYRMSQNNIVGNCTLNLHSTTGAVVMEITQTKTLQGNLAVYADTTTGGINVGLTIDGGVGAQITSQVTGFGNIQTDLNNFNGDKTPVQSSNYPAASNIEIHNSLHGFGGVNIKASYLTTTIAS